MAKVSCWETGQRDLSSHFAIRHQVFVEEQRVMVFTDVDDQDRQQDTIHVLAANGNALAGTVRLYRLDDSGTWQGDRLAVLPDHRDSMVGLRLVRFAVATAAAAGGLVMDATVQVPNTRFFERLGWHQTGPIADYFGIPHQPMAIDLPGAEAAQSNMVPNAELHFPVTPETPSPLLSS